MTSLQRPAFAVIGTTPTFDNRDAITGAVSWVAAACRSYRHALATAGRMECLERGGDAYFDIAMRVNGAWKRLRDMPTYGPESFDPTFPF